MSTSEQELRGEAIRRRLNGERRRDICSDLEWSTRWFDKWRLEFRNNPHTDFADHSRAPLTVESVVTPGLERLAIKLRQAFEAANHGLIGARAISGKLFELRVKPLPSEVTIQRILARAKLIYPLGVATETAYYPWLPVWEVNVVQATDIITKHIRGGVEIRNFHTLDLLTHAACLTQHLNKTKATTCRHLLKAWERPGLPCLHQFDNEGSFCGGQTHWLIIGRVVRLCLFCGVEAIFTPIYEAKRNHQIETFHSLWCEAFWSRQTFTDLRHVRSELPVFMRWYHHHYRPPCLEGKTPAEMRFGTTVIKLTAELRRSIPGFQTERLPVIAGRFHFMRKVDTTGHVDFLNERWLVGPKWIGEYVRATINTGKQRLTILHKAGDDADWRVIKSRVFRIKESVDDLLP